MSWPDRLTRIRLGALPLLWLVAALGETGWLAAGVALAAFTDVLDGAIARRYHLQTPAGSRLDSIADHLLTASLLVWLAWFRPAFVRDQLLPLAAWAALATSALVVGWWRFRRVGDLHLYSAKAAGTAGYLFAISLLLTGSYHRTVFLGVLALCFVASFESLLVDLTSGPRRERTGSILLRPRRRIRGGQERDPSSASSLVDVDAVAAPRRPAPPPGR